MESVTVRDRGQGRGTKTREDERLFKANDNKKYAKRRKEKQTRKITRDPALRCSNSSYSPPKFLSHVFGRTWGP
jgi:hypothetical protein